jgi:hypothetical protein
LAGNKASLDIEYFPASMNTDRNAKEIEQDDYMFGQNHFNEKTYGCQIEDIYKLTATENFDITPLHRDK